MLPVIHAKHERVRKAIYCTANSINMKEKTCTNIPLGNSQAALHSTGMLTCTTQKQNPVNHVSTYFIYFPVITR